MTKKPVREVADLVGMTLRSVTQEGVESLTFTTTDGRVFRLFHDQDCCEDVTIDDVCGDLQAIVGSPIIMAEEACGGVLPDIAVERANERYLTESETWTFYKFATVKGYLTVRWFGTSNGYYSESVDFCEMTPP